MKLPLFTTNYERGKDDQGERMMGGGGNGNFSCLQLVMKGGKMIRGKG